MLTAAERRDVARSIQQFQLGEWARGRGLKQRALGQAGLAGDAWFIPALELFIRRAAPQRDSGTVPRSAVHPTALGALARRDFPAFAQIGRTGRLCGGAGYGGSSGNAFLPGPPGCNSVEAAAFYLRGHSGGRSRSLKLPRSDAGFDSPPALGSQPNRSRPVPPGAIRWHRSTAVAAASPGFPGRRLELLPVLERSAALVRDSRDENQERLLGAGPNRFVRGSAPRLASGRTYNGRMTRRPLLIIPLFTSMCFAAVTRVELTRPQRRFARRIVRLGRRLRAHRRQSLFRRGSEAACQSHHRRYRPGATQCRRQGGVLRGLVYPEAARYVEEQRHGAGGNLQSRRQGSAQYVRPRARLERPAHASRVRRSISCSTKASLWSGSAGSLTCRRATTCCICTPRLRPTMGRRSPAWYGRSGRVTSGSRPFHSAIAIR